MGVIVMKWIIVVLATLNFGYMLFDGGRALISGDYIRPASGAYAGQLGPWSKLVNKIGVDPESTTMKMIFVVWGIIGLVFTACYAMNARWAGNGLLVINILSLWYLVPGTISSVLQIILLLIRKSIS
jgi:hypothetical protein